MLSLIPAVSTFAACGVQWSALARSAAPTLAPASRRRERLASSSSSTPAQA